ncbi:MAG: sigma-70 family RNA polymerase sigma factor [Myxococcales bacterium]|nr:sigma-70 family RNA polymerase sigma factor [Myxococcales bacterium]
MARRWSHRRAVVRLWRRRMANQECDRGSRDLLAERFEREREHLRGVAYRMLGSLPEADDAVQDAWLRLGRTDAGEIKSLRGWLTTVTARVCLDMLRARKLRREDPVGAHPPEPRGHRAHGSGPEDLLADSVGLALLVVLETLAPPERLAFVLHDLFAMPFDEIAAIVGRTPTATRQLASRARRRVQGADRVGQALYEATLTDHALGRFVNHDLAEYHVAVNADVGELDVIFVDEHDEAVNALGAKGVGEIGIVGVAAAIANAIYHATGRRVRDFPITLDKLL